MPKSSTAVEPSSRTITFSGLTSRCTMPAVWATPSVRAIAAPQRSTSWGEASRHAARSVRPCTSSIATKIPPSSEGPTS
jgi:hypothetical protein